VGVDPLMVFVDSLMVFAGSRSKFEVVTLEIGIQCEADDIGSRSDGGC